MWLGSGIAMAVAVAGNYSSDSTPSLGTSICRQCGPKKMTTTTTTKAIIVESSSSPLLLFGVIHIFDNENVFHI